jgi:hypothetical protein
LTPDANGGCLWRSQLPHHPFNSGFKWSLTDWIIYLIHKGPEDHGADPKSLALAGNLMADAEPNSESTVASHCQWRGIMFYAFRQYDTLQDPIR